MADWKKNKYDKNIRILNPGNAWLVDDTNDAQITVNPIFVGTVYPGSGYPTSRPNGDALSDGDYVKPDANATFPFTIGNVTFNTVNDQAVWDETAQEWKYDPSSARETAGVEVSDPVGEDYPLTDGVLANVQQDINMHFRYWLDWLVEEMKKAGYDFTLSVTDVDSNRSLYYKLIDKEGHPIREETFDNFLLNSRLVSGIDLTDDITSQELEESLKDIVVTYTGKTMDADDNTFINFRVRNFNADAITDSTEIATTSNWTDIQIPTTKAVMDYVGSDIDAVYDDGSTSVENPFITLYLKNATGATVDWCKVSIENAITNIQYVENGINQDNELDVTFENGFQVQIPLTNVVITDHVQTLTNKTIDADLNTITNLEVDNFKINTPGSTTAGVIVTEINDAEDDTMLPTAKAVYDYSTTLIDNEVDVTNNEVTIKLQDKNGVDKDTTVIPLQELEYEIADDPTNELTLKLTDGTDTFTEVEFEVPSDIEWVNALPDPTAARTDRLYTVYNEAPAALRWSDGTDWYDLADTNGVVTVAALPPLANARQDCLYYVAADDELNWYDGTEFHNLTFRDETPSILQGSYTPASKKITITLTNDEGETLTTKDIVIDNMVKDITYTAKTATDPPKITVTHIDGTVDADIELARDLTADKGIAINDDVIEHTNAVTADAIEGIKTLTHDQYGHITASTAITPDRGIDITNNGLGHTNSIANDSNVDLKYFSYDDQGHVTDAVPKTLGRGISDVAGEIGHAVTVTADATQDERVKAFSYDQYGHVTGHVMKSNVYDYNGGDATATGTGNIVELTGVDATGRYSKYTLEAGTGISHGKTITTGAGTADDPDLVVQTLSATGDVYANRGLDVDADGYIGHTNSVTANNTSDNRSKIIKYDEYGHIIGHEFKDKMYGCNWGATSWTDSYVNSSGTSYTKTVKAANGVSISRSASGNDSTYTISAPKVTKYYHSLRFANDTIGSLTGCYGNMVIETNAKHTSGQNIITMMNVGKYYRSNGHNIYPHIVSQGLPGFIIRMTLDDSTTLYYEYFNTSTGKFGSGTTTTSPYYTGYAWNMRQEDVYRNDVND